MSKKSPKQLTDEQLKTYWETGVEDVKRMSQMATHDLQYQPFVRLVRFRPYVDHSFSVLCLQQYLGWSEADLKKYYDRHHKKVPLDLTILLKYAIKVNPKDPAIATQVAAPPFNGGQTQLSKSEPMCVQFVH